MSSLAFLGYVGASVAVLAILFVPLERAWRARTQPILRFHIVLDGLFLLGQYVVWNGLTLVLLRHLHTAWLAVAPWRADGLPAAVQIVLAMGLGDLTMYGFHVACHRVPWLWRIHAVHHSATQLDWVAAHREHPLDGILTQLAMNLPALVLGLSFSLFAPLVIFRSVWAVAVHSNTRLPLGPLKWLIGAPELHRYHHLATERDAKNFSNLAPWVDWVFGTHHEPRDEEYDLGVVGLEITAGRPVRRYLGLLALPFLPRVAKSLGASMPASLQRAAGPQVPALHAGALGIAAQHAHAPPAQVPRSRVKAVQAAAS